MTAGERHRSPVRYRPGTRLLHHAGSEWAVVKVYVNGDYLIRCIGAAGGEKFAVQRVVHRDYLHGDGWTVER